MRIGVIGHAAFGQTYYDGQTVSTRLWINQLKKRKEVESVVVVDTFDYRHRHWLILINFFICMWKCQNIIIMLSKNGLKFFLPLVYYVNKIFHRNLYHRVIGGNIEKTVLENKKFVKYLNSMNANWVQSDVITQKLKKLGIENVCYLENFRDIKPIDLKDIPSDFSSPYKFCTFCRVTKLKGISEAIKAIVEINQEAGQKIVELHVYGPIDIEYRQEFELLLEKHEDCITYKGSVPSEQAVSILKDYYMNLFPTIWPGEGFPGTLIDCYNAGLPTIGSSWAYNEEFIRDGLTGYIYKWESFEDLKKNIVKAINLNYDELYKMRCNNLKEAINFTADNVISKIMKTIMLNESKG